jgi:hypothetical protein
VTAPVRALLVLLALASAGCASPGGGLGSLRGDARHDPYLREFQDALTPQYNRTYSFPVDAGASAINVTASLGTRSGGVLPGEDAPGSITVTLLDPRGQARGQEQLDPTRTAATLLLPGPLAPGTWHVQIVGSGGTIDAQAAQVSTVYAVSVGVAYA